MNNMCLEFEAGLYRLDPEAWLTRLEDVSEEHGHFVPLGPDHCATFLDAGTNLLVTFENALTIRKSHPDHEPIGFRFTRTEGWSHLAIISHGESWFRAPQIARYFDRLIDDGFFDDFENVLFYGTNGGGYAAAAYSVAAPGCNVLALRPQATLDPRIAGWDTRYPQQRRTDFSKRYGYAPDMIDAANHAFIGFDPMQRLDAIHAAMFTRANVTPLRCTGLGNRLGFTLHAMDILEDMMIHAMNKTLTEEIFNTLRRARRENITYLRNLYTRMMATDHPTLAANVCVFALRLGDNAFFSAKLEELQDAGHAPTSKLNTDAA